MRVEPFALIVLPLCLVVPTRAAELLVSEVVAANRSTITDEEGRTPDWIEIYNAASSPVALSGFALTKDPDRREVWRFPERELRAGGFLVVFASGRDRRDSGAALHTDFRLSNAGEHVALLDSKGQVVHAIRIPRLRRDEAYGLPFRGGRPLADRPGLLRRATPGAPNPPESVPVVSPPRFSIDSGFFEKAIEVVIQPPTPGARIRFTTDGSAPSESHGRRYESPLTISSTTPVRAVAFQPGARPSEVETRTYFFLRDVVRQAREPPAGWPASGVNGQVFHYGMASPARIGATVEEVIEALESLPTVSLVIDLADFFGRSRGIYLNAAGRGRESERPVAVELIDPSSREGGFRISAGIRIRGGASRRSYYPRRGFRLYFREAYGPPELRYPLFGDSGATTFDDIDLRCAQNYSWSHPREAPRHTYLRDVFSRDCQADLGQPTTRSRFYHLYINGIYWGIYQSQEHSEASYAATYFGGRSEDYDVVKVHHPINHRFVIKVTDGNLDGWKAFWEMANRLAASEDPPERQNLYRRLQGLDRHGREDPGLPAYLDVDNLIDYMLVIFYTGNFDAAVTNFVRPNQTTNNWFGIWGRSGREGFKFFVHDAEHCLGVRSSPAQLDRTGPWPAGHRFQESNPQWIHQQLLAVDEYRERFTARAHEVLLNRGTLSPQASLARLNRRVAQIERAIVAEAARWGDFRGRQFTKRDWELEVEQIRAFLQSRSEVVAEQIRRARRFTNGVPFAPLVDAPLFSAVPPPLLGRARTDPLEPPVIFRATQGTIHYTLDGSDPRRPDGTVSPQARVATGERRVSTTLLRATDPIRALVPKNGAMGTGWRESGFDDRSWRSGRPAVGYERRSGYERLIGLDLGDEMVGRNATAYTRSRFSVESPERFRYLTLRMRFEDGFVAYLNGAEVARSNAPATPVWNSTSTSNRPDGEAVSFQDIDISKHRAALRKGANVLAIHGLNEGTNSSDFLLAPEVTGVRVEGGPPLPLPPGAITLIRARVLRNGNWSPLFAASVKPGVDAAAAGSVVLSEIMYHAAPPDAAEREAGFRDADDFEYIELLNTSPAKVDLAHCRFRSGVEFVFPDRPRSILDPGERVVVVRNPEAFRRRHGDGPAVAGVYRGKLSNRGERLVLEAASGRTIQSVLFRTARPWPEAADGEGPSLVPIRPESRLDPDLPQNWRASSERGGTPGR